MKTLEQTVFNERNTLTLPTRRKFSLTTLSKYSVPERSDFRCGHVMRFEMMCGNQHQHGSLLVCKRLQTAQKGAHMLISSLSLKISITNIPEKLYLGWLCDLTHKCGFFFPTFPGTGYEKAVTELTSECEKKTRSNQWTSIA